MPSDKDNVPSPLLADLVEDLEDPTISNLTADQLPPRRTKPKPEQPKVKPKSEPIQNDPFDLPSRRARTRVLRQGKEEASEQPVEEDRSFPPGQLSLDFGPFTLGTVVGHGGMAEVRLAFWNRGGKAEPCVIKRISMEHSLQHEYRKMFLEEAKLSRRLNHPNIVRTLDTGEIENTPYIAFELIDGVTVSDLCKAADGRLPIPIVCQVAERVAAALEYAHTLCDESGSPLSLVHRDVSPQNILISRNGEVKLLDFGIARFRGREYETRMGDIKGKVRYMAPEQLARTEVDSRTDLFSLGIVMAEALGAVERTSATLISEVQEGPGDLPLALHGLLRSMTRKELNDRLASVSLVQRALQRILQEQGSMGLATFAERQVFSKLPAVTTDEKDVLAAPTLTPEQDVASSLNYVVGIPPADEEEVPGYSSVCAARITGVFSIEEEEEDDPFQGKTEIDDRELGNQAFGVSELDMGSEEKTDTGGEPIAEHLVLGEGDQDVREGPGCPGDDDDVTDPPDDDATKKPGSLRPPSAGSQSKPQAKVSLLLVLCLIGLGLAGGLYVLFNLGAS